MASCKSRRSPALRHMEMAAHSPGKSSSAESPTPTPPGSAPSQVWPQTCFPRLYRGARGLRGPRAVSAGAELSEPLPGATQVSLPRNQRLLLEALGGELRPAGRRCSSGDPQGWLSPEPPGWGRCPPALPSFFPPRFPNWESQAQLCFHRHSLKSGVLPGRAALQLCTVLPRGTHPPCSWGHKECPLSGQGRP